MMRRITGWGLVAACLLLAACGKQEATESSARSVELVVYSARKEHLIKPLFDQYTAETGVKIRYITDKAGPLLTRLQAEAENTPADILMTVDAGNLWHAADSGLLQPLQSTILEANVPAHLRDPQQHWAALTVRARTVVYSTDRVEEGELSTYEALGDEAWKGRLCLRTSKKVYNQSLVATMIAAHGEEGAEQLVKNWVANLAMPPFSNDTKVMEAIAAGQCDAGIVNTYYYGRLMKAQPELAVALFWPNQQGGAADGRGVHINVSGAGVVKHSKQAKAAQQLIEWLTETPAQKMLMELNQEYPVNAKLALSEELQAWGEFNADSINVSEAGRLQSSAVRLMDRAGYR
jgi:iron(III) transport system substrate-binding protein